MIVYVNRQIVIDPDNVILLSNKKNRLLLHSITRLDLQSMLSKVVGLKTTHSGIPFIQIPDTAQVKPWKVNYGFQGLGWEEGTDCKGA